MDDNLKGNEIKAFTTIFLTDARQYDRQKRKCSKKKKKKEKENSSICFRFILFLLIIYLSSSLGRMLNNQCLLCTLNNH